MLVGVKSYRHDTLTDLAYTENDVETLGEVLRKGGFDTVVTLTTTRGERDAAAAPTAANIRKQLKAVLARVGKKDVVVIALAGHGMQLRVEDPDGKRERDESFFCPPTRSRRGRRTSRNCSRR